MFATLLAILRALLRTRQDLLLENLALRQQILVLQRTNPKPPFRDRDRAFLGRPSCRSAGSRARIRCGARRASTAS